MPLSSVLINSVAVPSQHDGNVSECDGRQEPRRQILYWAITFNALLCGLWWWWWLTPIIVVIVLFIGLFLDSAWLDKIANPRLRRVH